MNKYNYHFFSLAKNKLDAMQKNFDDEQRIDIVSDKTSLPTVPRAARLVFIIFTLYFFPKTPYWLRYCFYFLDPNAKIYPVMHKDHCTYDGYTLSPAFEVALAITQLVLICALTLLIGAPKISARITENAVKYMSRIIHTPKRREALQYEIFLEELFEGIITVGHEPYPSQYWCVLSHSFARNPVQIVSKNGNSPLGKDITYDAQTLNKWFSIKKIIPYINIPFDEKQHTIRSLTEERNAFLREKINVLLTRLHEKNPSPNPLCENRAVHLLRMFIKAEGEKNDCIKSENSGNLSI